MKKFITALASLALMLGCLTPTQLLAADSKSEGKLTVNTVSGKRYVFANGNDVVIEQDTDGNTYAALKNDRNKRIVVDKDTFLFAGAEENGSYDEVTIEMKSGVIGTIIGSNKGPGSIGTSNIIIDNGTIGMAIGNQGAKAKDIVSGGGAASYEKRKEHTVHTVNITMNGGSAQALVPGSYGNTYVENANVTVNGGAIAATTSPMQAGVLGGTNGEIGQLTINFNGGTTKDIALMQRTMVTGKATVNVNGGVVGNIYAGSYYDDNDNALGTANWNNWGAGDVNYGQAAAIDVNIGSNAAYDNIFSGFQYVDKSVFVNKYKNWISTLDGSESAPLTIHMNAEPSLERGATTQKATSVFDLQGDFIRIPVTSVHMDKTELKLQTCEAATLHAEAAPSLAKDKNLVWTSSDPTIATFDGDTNRVLALRPGTAVITAAAGNVSASCTVTVDEVTAVIPPLDTTKPAERVEAGLNDKTVIEKLNKSIDVLAESILAGRETSMVSEETAAKIKKGLEDGKALTVEVVSQRTEASEISKEETSQIGDTLEQLSAKNDSSTGIAQYLDLRIVLKVGGAVVGNMQEASSPLVYSIILPENLMKEGRIFHVVRIHNGKAEILTTKQNEHILNFETDKFSTYAVIYEDKKADNGGTTTNPTPDTTIYDVVFVDHTGAVLKVDKVEAGASATAPQAPELENYRFVKWDTDFTKVSKNLLVKPIYEKITEDAVNTTPTEGEKNDKEHSSPDTGDTTAAGLFSAFALLGLVSMAIVVTVRKKSSLHK